MIKNCHPKRLLYLYLFAIIGVLIWVVTNFGTWSSPQKGDTQFPHIISKGEHNIRMQSMKIQEREAQLSQWEARLQAIEDTLRQRYPVDVQSLLALHGDSVPTIYAVTPTYARPVQKAELTRLYQTFLHVPKFHWIVVEDSPSKTDLVTNLLRFSGLPYTHLNIVTPPNYKMADEDPNWLKPRGVLQRNLALEWLRQNLDPDKSNGVLYFADDDNTYSLEVFEEMRDTKKVSVWPVGLVGKLRYETPILNSQGKVVSYLTNWYPERPFAMDMAGFAINVKLILLYKDAKFKSRVKRGYQESAFLEQLVTKEDLEPKAANCTKVLVWHTRTEKADLRNEERMRRKGLQGSDPNIEV